MLPLHKSVCCIMRRWKEHPPSLEDSIIINWYCSANSVQLSIVIWFQFRNTSSDWPLSTHLILKLHTKNTPYNYTSNTETASTTILVWSNLMVLIEWTFLQLKTYFLPLHNNMQVSNDIKFCSWFFSYSMWLTYIFTCMESLVTFR